MPASSATSATRPHSPEPRHRLPPYVLHRRPDAEAILILASIAARWNLTPEPGTTVSPRARAVLVPASFPVRLSARRPP